MSFVMSFIILPTSHVVGLCHRGDTMAFPQCITSNGIFRTGGHEGGKWQNLPKMQDWDDFW